MSCTFFWVASSSVRYAISATTWCPVLSQADAGRAIPAAAATARTHLAFACVITFSGWTDTSDRRRAGPSGPGRPDRLRLFLLLGHLEAEVGRRTQAHEAEQGRVDHGHRHAVVDRDDEHDREDDRPGEDPEPVDAEAAA